MIIKLDESKRQSSKFAYLNIADEQCCKVQSHINRVFVQIFVYRESLCTSHRRAPRRQQSARVWARDRGWRAVHFRIHVPGGDSRGGGRAVGCASEGAQRYGFVRL